MDFFLLRLSPQRMSSLLRMASKILTAPPSLPASNDSRARASVSGRRFLIGLNRVLAVRDVSVGVVAFAFMMHATISHVFQPRKFTLETLDGTILFDIFAYKHTMIMCVKIKKGSGLDKSQKDGLSSKTNNYLGKWKTLKII